MNICFLLGVYLGVEFLGHMVNMFNIFWNCQTLFKSSCTILVSYLEFSL